MEHAKAAWEEVERGGPRKRLGELKESPCTEGLNWDLKQSCKMPQVAVSAWNSSAGEG